jgi:hypothetical protein
LVTPGLGVGFGASLAGALVVISVAGLLILSARRTLRLPDKQGLVLGGAAMVSSLAFTIAIVLIRLTSERLKLAWMMGNDSAWNVMLARFVLEDGGFDPAKHGNVTPLTAEIFAFVLAPGRDDVPGPGLLLHDVERALQTLLLLLSVISVLGALVVGQAALRRGLVLLAAVASAAGVMPWTWFVAGYALSYGFWNALVALAILLLLWLAWLGTPRHPVLGSALCATGGLTMLATWAPLTVLPGVMGVVVLGRHWRNHLALRRRPRALIAWLLAVGALGVYAVMIMLPSFRSVLPSDTGDKAATKRRLRHQAHSRWTGPSSTCPGAAF